MIMEKALRGGMKTRRHNVRMSRSILVGKVAPRGGGNGSNSAVRWRSSSMHGRPLLRLL